MEIGDSINLLDMVKEGFVPYRKIFNKTTKEFTLKEESIDRLDFFSSMINGGLRIDMIHPDGRILIYGLHIGGKPPGFIWKNY